MNVTGKTTNDGFAGFFLQARRVNRKVPLGKFSHFSNGTQGLNCEPGNHVSQQKNTFEKDTLTNRLFS